MSLAKTQDELIEREAERIQAELEKRLRGFLGPGESIVFSMRIERVPPIRFERIPVAELRQMRVQEFFSRERFKSAETPSRLINRIRNGLSRHFTVPNETLGEFLSRMDEHRLRGNNLGKASLDALNGLLRHYGLPHVRQ